MVSLVMGFISLVDEIQFMLISSRHICIRSINKLAKDRDKQTTNLALETVDVERETTTQRRHNDDDSNNDNNVTGNEDN